MLHILLAKSEALAESHRLRPVPIDGRPRFAKRSFGNVKQVKIAAIDPDFV